MRLVRAVLITLSFPAVLVLGGCATAPTRTEEAAEKLEQRANAFAAAACYESDVFCSSSPQVAATHWLADQAQEFRHTCENGTDQQVVFAFQRLWSRYHVLRDEVFRARDRQLLVDFKAVTRAFVGVQLHVKNEFAYADPTLLGSGAYVFDPYYN